MREIKVKPKTNQANIIPCLIQIQYICFLQDNFTAMGVSDSEVWMPENKIK